MSDEFMRAHRELLENELELMERLRLESSRFEFTAFGAPPTRYEVVFRCRGLADLAGGQPIYADEHRAEIILHPDFPTAEDAVEIQWKTPILHPNIDLEHGPCIKGTPLGANIRIAEICEFLAEMIQYIRYNYGNHWKSDSAKEAAEWAMAHPESLPLDPTPLRDRAHESVEG
jgi:hypothetical protein